MKNNDENRSEDEIDLRSLFYELKSKWFYFLISILFFTICAFIYIHFSLPVYEATSSVIIKDSKNSSKDIEDIL